MKNSCAFLFLIITALTASVLAQQEYDYEEVLGLSIWFYEAQRCGILPDTNRVDWRWDSFVDDGSDVDLDLEGGYFDAGDHVKFGFPLAGTITILAWGVLDYRDGYLAAGEYENGLDMLRWGLDYMVKTHPEPNVIWVNVGNGTVDHSFWGRPEDWPEHLSRPSVGPINITHPGSDLAGEYAAAFASSSLVFRDVNTTYSKVLLRHAIECYDFAFNYRGRYSDNVYKVCMRDRKENAEGHSLHYIPHYIPLYLIISRLNFESPEYGSWAYEDELLWASVWLYRATTNTVYLDNARTLWDENYFGYTPQSLDWDNKLAGAQILLARFAGLQEPEYVTAAENFCRWVRNDARKTPLGLIFLGEWGSLRSIATVVFACLQAAEMNIDAEANRAMAVSQIGYALGDTGRSFVVGFGVDPPTRPHHRSSSCPSLPLPCDGNEALNNPGPNPQTLFGALVGGPGLDDSYVDDRQDYVKNEVALDYNAGFQSAIAGMISLRNRGLI